MSVYSKEDIFKIVEEEDVAFIRLLFCNIFGNSKNIAITPGQLKRALNNQCMFDGSAVEGFVRIGESDMYLYPDLDSFDIYPWRPQTGKVARLFCDIYTLDRKPFAGDPRYVLKKVLGEARDMGLDFSVEPSIEFFLFDRDDNGLPSIQTSEEAGFFDVAPADQGENARRDIILSLEAMHFDMASSHHETAPAQHEINFTGDKADIMADMIQTFKLTVKTIAKKHGAYATFLPKPREGVNGSGMALRFLARDEKGKNIFAPAKGQEGILSETAQYFIGGLLKHMKGITLITNPLVNSYKRLVPGFDAPAALTWSSSGSEHNALVRVPSKRGEGTAIELRSPDATANPYLAIALCIAAGLEGIRNKTKAPAEMKQAREESETLPINMGQAITAFKADPFIRDVLGDQVYDKFLKAKETEWSDFCRAVTDWEIKAYLSKY